MDTMSVMCYFHVQKCKNILVEVVVVIIIITIASGMHDSFTFHNSGGSSFDRTHYIQATLDISKSKFIANY